ncbi:MAG: hypothetical protein KJ018_00160 [Burkholderiales bacterium]|nr:hypothetical protein [Burkholderiales bacterium]
MASTQPAGAAPERLAEGYERRRSGDLEGAARCFLDALAGDPMLFDAGAALARTIAAEAASGRVRAPPVLSPPAAAPACAVVVCSNRPARFARAVAAYRRALAGVPLQIVGIHDARSLCEGFLRGLRASRGDVVLLSHDDVDILAPDFAARLFGALARFDVVGVAGATRLTGPAWGWAGHPHVHGWITHRPGGNGEWRPAFWSPWPLVAQAVVLDGVFIAARRDVFDAVGFDAAAFDGFHCYDVDFTWRAARAGLRIGVCGTLGLVHDSLGTFDARWQAYAARFVAKFPECSAPVGPSHRYEATVPTPALARLFHARLESLALAHLPSGSEPA